MRSRGAWQRQSPSQSIERATQMPIVIRLGHHQPDRGGADGMEGVARAGQQADCPANDRHGRRRHPRSGCPSGRAERLFFSIYIFGACRRRTPRTWVDLRVSKDASHPRPFRHHPPRFVLALGVRRRHAPKSRQKNRSALGPPPPPIPVLGSTEPTAECRALSSPAADVRSVELDDAMIAKCLAVQLRPPRYSYGL